MRLIELTKYAANCWSALIVGCTLWLTAATPLQAQAENSPLASETPPAGMLRFPAISADYIAFGYATQLWIVPREGGVAKPVAFPRGSALQAAFSPDGQWIAFIANYDGQRDIYAIPVQGGVPRRLTTHPGGKNLHTWTRCGSGVVYSTSAFAGSGRVSELYIAPLEPGLPQRMPVAYGVNATFSPDGDSIAFMTHTRDFRTWKRYRGGMATDIWTLNLETSESARITDWEGTDTLPMWQGDNIYYLSDEGSPYRLNVWRFNVTTGERSQILFSPSNDVRFPFIGTRT
ncbi:MAG: hypothetical protein LR015_11095 [Verrucomicrobia bacterium]|nr:hypothetical protein [Verrucomicrobiota bacterium]